MTVRVCPERDAVCPHGINCPYAKDRYSCREGWKCLGLKKEDKP